MNSQFIAARNLAMGSAFLGQEDLLSANSNISKLTSIDAFSVGIGAVNRFTLKELQNSSLVVATPLLHGHMALSISQYGFNLYRQNRFSIAYALAISPAFSMGLQLNYRKLYIDDGLKKRSSIYPNLALNYKINPGLELSFLLTNITLENSSLYRAMLWPTAIHIGVAYKINSKVRNYLESSLDLEFSMQFRYGLEYAVTDVLILRIGFASRPSSFSMGFSLLLKNFSLDIASAYDPFLGFSPAISILYEAL